MLKCPHCKKEINNYRTQTQSNALHLLFKQTSDMCIEKGIDMREIVREEVPIDCTPENIKWLWKLLQKAMLGKESTTKLSKHQEIDRVYDQLNKILIERTEGEISLPPFPYDEEKARALIK